MNKGIALLTALFSLVLMLVIGSLALFLVVKSMRVSQGQARYQSTFEATEGGIEIGMAEVDTAFRLESSDSIVRTVKQDLSNAQHIETTPQFISTVPVTGGAYPPHHGYEGIGASMAHGGAVALYIIPAEGRGPTRVRVNIDVIMKKTKLLGGG